MKLGCVVMQQCPCISLFQWAGIATSQKLWIQTFQESSKLLNPGQRILCSWEWRGARSSFLSPQRLLSCTATVAFTKRFGWTTFDLDFLAISHKNQGYTEKDNPIFQPLPSLDYVLGSHVVIKDEKATNTLKVSFAGHFELLDALLMVPMSFTIQWANCWHGIMLQTTQTCIKHQSASFLCGWVNCLATQRWGEEILYSQMGGLWQKWKFGVSNTWYRNLAEELCAGERALYFYWLRIVTALYRVCSA